MPDISIRLFLTADEFVALLDHARGLGADVLYSVGANRFERASRGAPLPDELRGIVRGAKHRWTMFLVAGEVEPGVRPDALAGRLVTAYFGGSGDGYLNMSESATRSADAPTRALAKAVKSYLTKISKPGVGVFALPDGEVKAVNAVRYTDGAARALRSGIGWRASGVANNGYTQLDPAAR